MNATDATIHTDQKGNTMSDFDEILRQIDAVWDEGGTAGRYFDVVMDKWASVDWLAAREANGSLVLAIAFRADGEDDSRFEIAGEYGGVFIDGVAKVGEELAKPVHAEEGWGGLPVKSTRGADLYVGSRPYDDERYLITFGEEEGTEFGGIDPQDGPDFIETVTRAFMKVAKAVAENS